MSIASPLASCWTISDLVHSLRSRVLGDAVADEDENLERWQISRGADPWSLPIEGARIIDRRQEVRGRRNRRGRPRSPISWSRRTGATVHQTGEGVLHPEHPGVLSIPAHILIHRPEGLTVPITLLHPLTIRMPHAHRLNSETWGVEVDCRAWGIVGNPNTFPRKKREKQAGKVAEDLVVPPHPLQLAVLERVLLRGELVHESKGRPFGVFAHAQGDESRRKVDPGEVIAREIDEMRVRHGWPDLRDETRGSGEPWPEEWRAAA